jgi:uncharacterized protein involved in exopolysaccharide biosynthesis
LTASGGNPGQDEEDLDLGNLLGLMGRHRWFIGVISFVVGALAAAYAFTAAPVFRAETVIVAVHEKGLNGSGLSNQLGALTSLVGVNIGAAGGDTQAADAVLDSRRLVEEFIRRNDLLPVLTGKAKKPLTIWLAVKQFKEGSLAVRKDTRRGTTTVAVDWTDAAIAAQWANGLVRLANELIRTRAIEEATRDIAYLNHQLDQTNAVELRQALYEIIKNETKTLMLANGRVDYAFEVVDPAVAPERKVGPHRALLTLVGLAIGFFVGTGVALIRERAGRVR